ncbi:MAG: helix-turn-helix domain-containing protein [Silvibacterium sp.]
MKTNVQRQAATTVEIVELNQKGFDHNGFPPERVESIQNGQMRSSYSMRMYTEEQVAAILQISLSQLRKWRLKQNKGRFQGPPFRKIGRLVRYPGKALQTYIDGD